MVLDSIPLHTDENAALAQSLCDQASQCYEQGDYSAARSLYERALAIHERVSGTTHPDTARCLNGLGMALAGQGDYVAAQPLVERALAIREQVLGVEHPDTAESLHSLGGIRFDRGEFDAGQALMEQAFGIRQRALGAEHPDTIESMRILAGMLAYRGDRVRAEQLLTEALSICERTFGERHRSTAKVLNALGVFWAADKTTYAQARAVYEQALAINEQLLGPNHPHTARSLNNLAAVLADMGDDAAAISLLERSLAAHEQTLGAKHPLTAFVLINLADIYKRQHNYAAARPLLERTLIIREQALGAQHPETTKSLRRLVVVLEQLYKQGDEKAMTVAIPLHTCLMAFEAAAGTPGPAKQHMPGSRQDPTKAAKQLHEWVAKLEAELNRPPLSADDQADLQTARDLRRQADQKFDQGDYTAAQALLEQALAIQERVLGENHLDHVELLKKLAEAKKMQGQYSAVLPLVQRVADIHAQVLGPGHPTTLLALTDLMSQYSQEYDLAAAMPLQERILRLQEETLGPDDPIVVMGRNTFSQMQAMLAQKARDSEPPRLSRSEKREHALATLPAERPALLAGMDDINWHNLHHAHGPADDVPNLLRLLLSDDESVRQDAWHELYGNVWHQGTVYEASAYVVPFLLKMLVSDGPPEKDALLQFLISLAEGSSYLAAHARLGDDQIKWWEILAKQGRDLETELQKELAYVEAVNHAVGEGVPIYFDLLNHEDAEIRQLSLSVLASLRGRTDEIVPRLRALLPTVQDAGTRAGVIGALHALMDDDIEAQQFFTDLMQRGEGRRITFIAAVALTERAREQTPEAAVDILLNALQERGKIPRRELLPAREKTIWEWGDLRLAVEALLRLGRERSAATLLRVLPMIQDGEDALEVAGILLDLAFNNGQVQNKSTSMSLHGEGTKQHLRISYWQPKPQPPREASNLNDAQRTVLAALVAHDPVWEHEHDLLKLYGLPISRQELRQFIA